MENDHATYLGDGLYFKYNRGMFELHTTTGMKVYLEDVVFKNFIAAAGKVINDNVMMESDFKKKYQHDIEMALCCGPMNKLKERLEAVWNK